MNTITTTAVSTAYPDIADHISELEQLADNPQTVDNERYARKTRAFAKACAEAIDDDETTMTAHQIRTLFVGLHRRLDWDAPVWRNASLIASTLGAAEVLCGGDSK